MEYFTNPEIPENIDGGRDGHGRTFLRVVFKALVFFFLLIVAADILARILAPFVPFDWEEPLAPTLTLKAPEDAQGGRIERELNILAQKVAEVMNLPPEAKVIVHYSDGETVNAAATFGGHIIIYKGLLELLESEDALAAVLAHEIGHIKNRDLIKGLFRVVTFSLVVMAANGYSESGGLESLLGDLGLLGFSRWQEDAADLEATLALGRLYGHTKGFEESFLVLQAAKEGHLQSPELFSTHPDILKRINRSKKRSAGLGLPTEGSTQPLGGALMLRPKIEGALRRQPVQSLWGHSDIRTKIRTI